MERLCPVCRSALKLMLDDEFQEELDCTRCGALFSRRKGTVDFDVMFPGVPCPACSSHDVEGYALLSNKPFAALRQLELADFVFRCPRTKRLAKVTFGEAGLDVALCEG